MNIVMLHSMGNVLQFIQLTHQLFILGFLNVFLTKISNESQNSTCDLKLLILLLL